MTPISPVVPGSFVPEVVFARDQPQYLALPAVREPDGSVITRWHATWRERLRVLVHGDVWLTLLTFGAPLQPVKLAARCPIVDATDADDDFGKPYGDVGD